MKFASRYLVLGVIVFGCSLFARASATQFYVTPTGTATGNCPSGTAAAPNVTPTQFSSNSSYWGSGTGQIGAGTTIKACGKFTGAKNAGFLYFGGGGASGNPLTFTCDTGTTFSSPQWAGGSDAAIVISGKSYITLNGAQCTIENTANGSGLANNAYSTGIWASGSNLIVENFTISNICQHTSVTDHNGCQTSGNLPAAIISSGSNITVQGNVINDSAYGIFHRVESDTNVVITGNTINRCNQHIAVGTAGSGNSISNFTISKNKISNAVNWDDGVTDTFHHNGIFIFQGSGGSITDGYIYDNVISGDFGVNDTSYIFFDPNSSDPISSMYSFNNLMVNTSPGNSPANGYFTGLGQPPCAGYNNTIVGNGHTSIGFKADNACTIQNNIVENVGTGIYVNAGSSLGASDYNDFYNLGSTAMVNGSSNYSTVAAWHAATGFDGNSVTGNPTLSSAYIPQAGSAAIGAGANLSSLGIKELNADMAGAARPTTQAWTLGAFENTTDAPAPPTGLVAVAR